MILKEKVIDIKLVKVEFVGINMKKHNPNLFIKKENNKYIVYDNTNNDVYGIFNDNLNEAYRYIAWNNMNPESQKQYLHLISEENKETIFNLYLESNE